MRLYIMRHGPAGQHGDPRYPDDAERPLTKDGAKKTRRCARGMRRLGIEPSRVLTSPLVRARQTAELVCDEIGLDTEALRETPALSPGAGAQAVFDELHKEAGNGAVLLVGHEPDLSQLISQLTAGDANSVKIDLKKAGVCALELESPPPEGRGTIEFLMQPGQLRALA